VPVVSNVATATLVWTPTMPFPTQWRVWQCTAAGVTIAIAANVTGSTGVASGLTLGNFYFIQGIDGSGNPVSAPSNVVHVTV
jgi:hypothetical protein